MRSLSVVVLLGVVALAQGQFGFGVPKLPKPPAGLPVPTSLSPFSLDDVLSLSPADQLAKVAGSCPEIQDYLSPSAILQNLQDSAKRIAAAPIDGVQQGFTCLSALSRSDYLGILKATPDAEAESASRPEDDDEKKRRKRRAAPASVDWRSKGQVNEIQNQGVCGSCWTFSANAALEAAIFRKTGQLPNLSEQSLVDCVQNAKGCDGGWMTEAYKHYNASGTNDEPTYPYDAKKNPTCKSSESADKGRVGGIKKYVYAKKNDEEALKNKLAKIGPIAAAMDSTELQHYKGGIYSCEKFAKADHAILLVGYGTTDKGEDYWLVKNSHGKTWGEDGYLRVIRGKGAELACGIPTYANWPVMA